MKLFFIADIVGDPGRTAVWDLLPGIREEFDIDLCIGNGENAAGGLGITPKIAVSLRECGIDVITSGNHIWNKREILPFLGEEVYVLRPMNYPEGAPGSGYGIFTTRKQEPVGIINLQGRVFMQPIDCPFKAAEKAVTELKKHTNTIFVDIHAEATSEKRALGWFLDGKVSAVIGTHTHVQTGDEDILPQGTAYLTDAGMTGSFDSVIGMEKSIIIKKFLSQLPIRFSPGRNDPRINGVVVDIDINTGKALSITRVSRKNTV